MKISEIGERELIKRISAVAARTLTADMLGIGDDAALTKVKENSCLVTSKDLLVEGVHFLLPGITARDLGYKALAVNLSDLAAMGASPHHAFVALAIPPSTDCEFILEFYEGLVDLAFKFKVAVSGCDTVISPGPLVVSVTVQGEVEQGKALLRSGAKAGDLLCTTGELGASAAGLLILEHNLPCAEKIRTQALLAHYRPQPRIKEGKWLAKLGVVTAAMDISDGLSKDVLEICQSSGCGAVFYEDKIPIHPIAAAVAPLQGIEPLALALHGGEDYELLFTIPEELFASTAQSYYETFGRTIIPIGKITEAPEIGMVTKTGKWEKLLIKGYQHF